MCGICGTVGIIDKILLEKMCHAIRHRGPDDSGYFIDSGIGLGHRRLSIIDLKSGRQPMQNEDGSIWIVFNGEIYNFMSLKDELEKKGHRFHTASDTEVIVHAYEEFGESCPEHLTGMFAFAIWDNLRKTLFLARDRLGKKPLYYTINGDRLLFASEIKSIIQYGEVKREVDITALRQYLTFGYVPAPRTMFAGINKLPAGCTLTFDDGKSTIRKYWDLNIGAVPAQRLPEEHYVEQVRQLFTEAVRCRLMSEVPLGAFLSGGLDSSSVVAVMSRLKDEPVKTITASFEEGGSYDETRYARLVAEHFGTEHHEVVLGSKDIGLLPEVIWHFDEPVLDASAFPEYMIAEKAKKYVTVVLVGEGSDELFLGYAQHRLLPRMHSYQKVFPGFIKNGLVPAAARALAGIVPSRKARRYLDFISNMGRALGDRREMYRTLIARFTEPEKQRLVTASPEVEDPLMPFFTGDDLLGNMQSFEIKVNLPENYLMNVDKMTMAHAIEARAPFLDHRLVEYAASMPAGMKLRGSDEKYVLKKMMTGILPGEILRRKKHPFTVPIVDWFEKDLKELTAHLLTKERVEEQGYFNHDYVRKVLSKSNPNYNQPLALVYFELWHRIFIESDDLSNPDLSLWV